MEKFIRSISDYYQRAFTANQCRFHNWKKLFSQFEEAVASWRDGNDPGFQGVTERINEMAVAEKLLSDQSLSGYEIFYEPTIGATDRSLDFKMTKRDERPIYVEVKTIRPEATDPQALQSRHQMIRQFIAENNTFIMGGVRENEAGDLVDDPEMGNYLAYLAFTARSKFLHYTVDIEQKITDVPQNEKARFILLFCSDGFSWHLDELEDFADFYKTGRFREDDPFRSMQAHHLTTKNIQLQRTLESFAFLERHRDQVALAAFRCPV
jgi:hypothetical protein